jgi:dCTP deaminase
MPDGVVSGEHLAHLLGKGLVTPAPRVEGTEPWVIPLHLGDQFLEYYPIPNEAITPPRTVPTRSVPLDGNGKLLLEPGDCVLACTRETVNVPLEVMGWISTKGNVARSFLTAHVCDGQIDPGYFGTITLELVNHGPFRFALEPGMAIANLYLLTLSDPVNTGYEGRFWGSVGPTAMIGVDIYPKEDLPSPHLMRSVGMRRRIRIRGRHRHGKTYRHRSLTQAKKQRPTYLLVLMQATMLIIVAMAVAWFSRLR